jgi:hypothetical protein
MTYPQQPDPQPAHSQPPAKAPKHKLTFPTWLIAISITLVALCCVGGGILAVVGIAGTTVDGDPEVSTQQTPAPKTTSSEDAAPEVEESPAEPELTVAQEQAVISAESYLTNVGGFSRSGLIDQLKFEGFSGKDAEFAVDYVDPDWMEQAVISAESYMDNVGGFSRQGLIDQLEFEGFTAEEAEHGADEVGL